MAFISNFNFMLAEKEGNKTKDSSFLFFVLFQVAETDFRTEGFTEIKTAAFFSELTLR